MLSPTHRQQCQPSARQVYRNDQILDSWVGEEVPEDVEGVMSIVRKRERMNDCVEIDNCRCNQHQHCDGGAPRQMFFEQIWVGDEGQYRGPGEEHDEGEEVEHLRCVNRCDVI